MNLNEAHQSIAALVRDESRPGQIQLELDGAVAHLRIDNPSARGALTLAMMRDLITAVHQLTTFDGALLVVSSTDPAAFCAGGHLADVERALDEPGAAEQMSLAMTTALDALSDLPLTSVAALDGLAIGGGAELALACDWRLASPEARIHFIHTKLGIAPGWGGTARLTRLVGPGKALRILTSARYISSGEAHRLGLVDKRCDGSAVEETMRWCRSLLARDPAAVRAVKTQIVAARNGDIRSASQAFGSVWGGPAHRKALERLERHRR
ncbi:MAG: enoyl-CoA hydratase/isomerase family protein [Myxococcota bacterium]